MGVTGKKRIAESFEHKRMKQYMFENLHANNNIKKIELEYNVKCRRTLFSHDLSFVDTYSTKDLKNELIQRKLIKNDFDEYFHFTNLKSEEKIEKQLDLDYFLNF